MNWVTFGLGFEAGVGIAWLLFYTVAMTVLFARKRRTGPHPGAGAGPAPVPGTATPPAVAAPGRAPVRPGPAPGPPPHNHGGLNYVIRAWNCGCIHLYDGTGALTGCTPCTSDLDTELRGLTP
jgi:hypothetical protein